MTNISPETIAGSIRAEIADLPRRDTPSMRGLRKAWSAKLKATDAREVVAVAEVLERAAPQEGKWVAYELIRHHKGACAAVGAPEVEDFASRIESWYATDAFGTVLSGPLWAAGRLPDILFEAWAHSADRWLRRSALVATVGLNSSLPGRKGDPSRTFPLCLALAADRDDMVEKAASWALRFLSQRDKAAVVAFMAAHGDRFGARVRREVRHKLETGLKSRRR
jgi:3-methyladenine DNA glycosylase AlkD